MKFDEVLEKTGQFGLYQKRLLFLVCLTAACVIMQNLSPVFTMNMPSHRCKIPGYPNDTYEIQNDYHRSLINRTIPLQSDGSYAECSIYSSGGEEPPESTHNRTETSCSEWLNLVCENKIYRSHSNMMLFAGRITGAFLNGAGGDYFGRRRVFMVMMVVMSASAIGMIFMNSLPLLMFLRFTVGGAALASYLCNVVIVMELVGPAYRRWAQVGLEVSSISINLLATLFAYLLRDWRHFQATVAAFIPESTRWLMSKGRMSAAQKIIDGMARTNGVSPAPQVELVDDVKQKKPDDADSPDNRVISPLELFRIPRLFLRYTLLYCSWICIVMCLYGLMLNVSNMSGDIFVNFGIMSALNILSLLIFTLLNERVGRRLFLVGTTGVGGLACLATIIPVVLLVGNDWILRGLSLGGRMFISAAMSGIYIMSPELFPTVLRSFGLGSCSMMSNIGGLVSPYVADLNTYVSGVWGPALPQVVFGIAGVTTAGMVLVLPETRGRHLPETVRDAEMFG
ncbi:hypothetical protein BaRGS_00017203, partial [Batillaria attramentaria]